jgi:hypothetical protein
MSGDALSEEQFGLSDESKARLAFEKANANLPPGGRRDSAIFSTFGSSPTHHYQIVNSLLDHPEAVKHDPTTVNRLRRVRDSKRAARADRAKGNTPDSRWGGPNTGSR